MEIEIEMEIEKTLRDSETLRPFKMGSGDASGQNVCIL